MNEKFELARTIHKNNLNTDLSDQKLMYTALSCYNALAVFGVLTI